MLLSLLGFLAGPPEGLTVREDPMQPAYLEVSFGRQAPDVPLDVTWFPPRGARPITYRSPDLRGFSACIFLREVGAAAVPGPHDVVVERGSAVVRLEIAYDGRSCLVPYPTPSVGAPKRLTRRIPEPVGSPVPVVILGPTIEEWRPADAVIERSSVTLTPDGLVFEVAFDRRLKVEPNSRLILTKLIRVYHGEAILDERASFPFTLRKGRLITWRVPIRTFRPPTRKGERIAFAFVLDGHEFSPVPTFLEVSS